jgi:hypothetical protein
MSINNDRDDTILDNIKEISSKYSNSDIPLLNLDKLKNIK